MCSVRNLKNITEETIKVNKTVVADTSTDSTVAFIAPGPANQPYSTTNVLYVGVTYTGNSELPAVSSRSLLKEEILEITDKRATKIFLSQSARGSYPIHYVYGFSSGGFSYFLTTQKRDTTVSSPYISKLVRVCQKDPHYDSYTEVPLECATENGTKFPLVQAAHLVKPGLSTGEDGDILYSVFAQSTDDGISNRPADRSALCIFTLKSIRQKFMENIKNCYDGRGSSGYDFIMDPIGCKQKVKGSPSSVY